MAVSFSRPDPASPAAVSSATFPTVRKGFDPEDVRDFLRLVATELARLQERERQLERELAGARSAVRPTPQPLDEDMVTEMLGEEAARVLATAREASSSIRSKAEEGASRLLRQAQDEAAAVREQAELEAVRRRQDAAHDAEAEMEQARQQGREMVEEARQYRERVLTDLSRRRELARQQISHLTSGRDRLIAAYERARLVAVDVISEVGDLGDEPDEYVNLAATTGPVPLTVPRPTLVSPIRPVPAASVAAPAFSPVTSARPAAPAPVAPVADHRAEPVTRLAIVTDADADADADAGDDTAVALTDDVLTEDAVAQAEIDADDAESDDPLAGHVDGAADSDELVHVGGGSENASADTFMPGNALMPGNATANAVFDIGPAGDSSAESSSSTVDSSGAGDEHHDRRGLAPVVSLFGDLPADAIDDIEVAASASDPNDDASDHDTPDQNDTPDHEQADGAMAPTADGTTIDDLFAKLRAARAHDIARDVFDTQPLAIVEARLGEEPAAPAAESAMTQEDEADEAAARVAALASRIGRALKRVLADEQNDVLGTLRRKETVRSLDVLVPWEGDHVDRYVEAISDDAGGGIDEARQWLSATIIAPLRRELQSAVDAVGADNIRVSNDVRAIYRDLRTQTIDETAQAIAGACVVASHV